MLSTTQCTIVSSFLMTASTAYSFAKLVTQIKLVGVTLDVNINSSTLVAQINKNVCKSSRFHIWALCHIHISLTDDMENSDACFYLSHVLIMQMNYVPKIDPSTCQSLQKNIFMITYSHLNPIARASWTTASTRFQIEWCKCECDRMIFSCNNVVEAVQVIWISMWVIWRSDCSLFAIVRPATWI